LGIFTSAIALVLLVVGRITVNEMLLRYGKLFGVFLMLPNWALLVCAVEHANFYESSQDGASRLYYVVCCGSHDTDY